MEGLSNERLINRCNSVGKALEPRSQLEDLGHISDRSLYEQPPHLSLLFWCFTSTHAFGRAVLALSLLLCRYARLISSGF